MASGYGVEGRTSRCYPFWRDTSMCVQQYHRTNELHKCVDYFEDYVECLHHFKERSRKIYLHELKQLENEGFRVHRDGFSGQYSATKIPAEELASVRAGAK